MGNKIGNEVYVKRFDKKLKIENVFVVGGKGTRYVYQISYEGTTYILKGFKIQVEHVDPEDKNSVKIFEQNLMKMSEVFQEYHFARAASLINIHVAKPLSLDLAVELAKDRISSSYLHMQMIFEYGGVALDKLQPTTIKQTYNLMRQSANALLLLHNLEIAHFDIKPANMVYDTKKDLLKIVDMGSAFGGSNKKRLGATTVTLEGKVTTFTPEFAPPEVLSIENSSIKELNMKLSLPGIDVYCWAMSFFATLTNRTNDDLRDYPTKYKTGSEADYKGFIKKVVEIGFSSIKLRNSEETELMTVVSNLLTRALQYKPKERPVMKDAIHEMKKFEREKKYTLKYSNTELEHSKEFLKLLLSSDDIDDNSLNELLNKNRNKDEVKLVSKVVDNTLDVSMSLSCNHKVSKDQVINYVLKLFVDKKSYKYSCLCEACKKVQKLKSLSLSCNCIWKKFGKKIEYNNDLTKASYGKCDKGHPLTSIDLGLINDFVSFEFTSLMITDYPQKKENLVNSFNEAVEKESLKDIAWILRYTKAVTKLNLSLNNIGDEGAKVIGEVLRTNTTLTQLHLSENNIGDEGAKVIGEVLRTNTTLAQLDLSWNKIGDEGTKVIGEALRINTTLTQLSLSKNNIGNEGAKVIGEVLRTNTTLTQLYLSSNNIGYEGAKVIGEVLRTNTTLTQLNLFSNNIGYEGAKVIGEVLRTNTTLTQLYLSSNNIGYEGAKLIGEVLRTNTTLTQLNLSKNNIGNEGAKVIGEVLRTNTTLTQLRLSWNNIGDEGAKVIGEALRINTTLTQLNLSKNNIGHEGARVIGEALKVNTTLKSLELYDNQLGAEGEKLLKEVREKHKGVDISYQLD